MITRDAFCVEMYCFSHLLKNTTWVGTKYAKMWEKKYQCMYVHFCSVKSKYVAVDLSPLF